jgi:hypothetical protein
MPADPLGKLGRPPWTSRPADGEEAVRLVISLRDDDDDDPRSWELGVVPVLEVIEEGSMRPDGDGFNVVGMLPRRDGSSRLPMAETDG